MYVFSTEMASELFKDKLSAAKGCHIKQQQQHIIAVTDSLPDYI